MASFFSHYQTEHLSDIYGNLFDVVLPLLYHVMDALVKLKPSDIELYLTVLDAHIVHGRVRQSSYHVANCFDLRHVQLHVKGHRLLNFFTRCARRPIRRHTLVKGPVLCLVILNAPASTEFCQERIDSLQNPWSCIRSARKRIRRTQRRTSRGRRP